MVCNFLGLPKKYEVDWQVFRHLIQNEEVRALLDGLVDEASRREGVETGNPNRRLRHLDVVLWMYASSRGQTTAPGAVGAANRPDDPHGAEGSAS